jgi:hypothetical protein
MSDPRNSLAGAAMVLGGLPLDDAELAYLEEIAPISRQGMQALYNIEGIRYAEPVVVFRLERPAASGSG